MKQSKQRRDVGTQRAKHVGKPLMKLPESQKTEQWAKDCVDYFSGTDNGFIVGTTIRGLNRTRVKDYYDVYNNKTPDRFFKHIVNPLSTNKSEHTHFGAKIREFSIIRPNIDFLVGKFRARPFSYSVNVSNYDAVSKAEQAEFKAVMRALDAIFMEEIDPQGRPIQNPEEVRNMLRSNYRDERAIQGQAALDYIVDVLGVQEQAVEAFKDYVISGYCFTYKDVHFDQIVYERVNPLACSWDYSVRYIEDGEFFCRQLGKNGLGLNLSQIVDMFYDELSSKDISDLETHYGYGLEPSEYGANGFLLADTVERVGIPVVHVTWKCFRKVGILEYVNGMGETVKTTVDESYKKQSGETLTWIWISEVWEGYRIGSDKYVRLRPIQNQRRSMNCLSECKLPYNGRAYSNTNAESVSIVQIGMPYQILYIGIMWQLEKLINKNKGKVIILDKHVIPRKEGWDEEKFFYYADALGYMIVDRNQHGVDKAFNQYQALDMSTIGQVNELIGVLEYIKRIWDESIGFTPQTKGQQIQASSKVGAVQQSIEQSAIINEELYGSFDDFLRRELTGLLDVSKGAWRDTGKAAMYLSSDMRNQLLSIDPANYMNADFGVYVANNSRNTETLEAMRQMAMAFAQNGHSPATILDVIVAKNPAKLRDILKDAQDKMDEMAQQQSLNEGQLEQSKMENAKMMLQMGHMLELDKMQQEYDRKERLEAIKATVAPAGPDTSEAEANKMNVEREKILAKQLDAELNRQSNERQTAMKVAGQERVAKQNKNKYDK